MPVRGSTTGYPGRPTQAWGQTYQDEPSTSKPAFSHRHYETIAGIMYMSKPVQDTDVYAFNFQMAQWENTCLAFLNHFRKDNPGFKAELFLAACRGEKRGKR